MPTLFDDLSLEHSETRSCSNRAARASNDAALAERLGTAHASRRLLIESEVEGLEDRANASSYCA